MSRINRRAIFCIVVFVYIVEATAQSPAPAPAGPLNITAILEKAGQFQTLIRLMTTTQVANQVNNELNDSNVAMTIFAPTDNAFSSLPPGTLNSLSDQEKVSLIQFDIVSKLLSPQQLQTVSNPISTQGGGGNQGQYTLNITSFGNSVNISTGVMNTTISGTVYADSQLVVYQVDKVLLPMGLFGPKDSPAPAPTHSNARKRKSSSVTARTPASAVDNSAQKGRTERAAEATAAVAAAVGLLIWL